MRALAIGIAMLALLAAPTPSSAAPATQMSDSAKVRQGWGLVVNRDGEASDLKSLGVSLSAGDLKGAAIEAGYGWRRGANTALLVGYAQRPNDALPGALPANPRYPGQQGDSAPSVLGVSFTLRR